MHLLTDDSKLKLRNSKGSLKKNCEGSAIWGGFGKLWPGGRKDMKSLADRRSGMPAVGVVPLGGIGVMTTVTSAITCSNCEKIKKLKK